jgi:hypothetical protein
MRYVQITKPKVAALTLASICSGLDCDTGGCDMG